MVLLACVFLGLGTGCGGGRADFIGSRAKDVCDAEWPVCSKVAGCILGAESYTEGRLPGKGQFIVQLQEASTVRVRFFLEDVVAAGEETVVTFQEEGCRARTREAVSGRTALDSAEKFGEFSREADLTGVGDHLIEFTSDMQARYVLKVEVLPLRNR
ncbi:hypothetical protein [Hyalangium minutum]|uniref:Uncharacterized protein n=1 Tax=Hyalangium minutum TaxID=394096 RepID=A0A085WC14_9BACT|nr:hypothetical protein [Hyalangium minutum]KFE65227.1 hypothetical protein DB31_1343 [Hyalangium minutum]